MIIRCKQCGGADVQIAMWVRPNLAAQINDRHNAISANAVVDNFGSWNSYDTQWCENCENHVAFVNEEGAKTYVIRNRYGADYWSNLHGWGRKKGATTFTQAEKNKLALPFDGEWVEVGE